jgi:protein-S-isoprenylcysteine O-methyltransferase Ste14
VNEFGTKERSKAGRFAARIAVVGLVLGFIATCVVVWNHWLTLDVGRVYLYMLLFLGYLAVERRTFRGPDEDAYTERMWVRYLVTYAWWFLAIGTLLEHTYTLRNHPTITIIGVVMCAVGLILGYWASGTLTGALGKRVDTWATMRVVETGPYRWIRHPSYAGSTLVVIGLALVMNAYLSLILSAMLVGLFLQRLVLEEHVLSQRIPAYANYMQRTYRLIPGIW